jgi:hypothetical protein
MFWLVVRAVIGLRNRGKLKSPEGDEKSPGKIGHLAKAAAK